jgi:hypothetical protein
MVDSVQVFDFRVTYTNGNPFNAAKIEFRVPGAARAARGVQAQGSRRAPNSFGSIVRTRADGYPRGACAVVFWEDPGDCPAASA